MKDLNDHGRIEDQGDEPASAAAWALQYIDQENSDQQLRPEIPALVVRHVPDLEPSERIAL